MAKHIDELVLQTAGYEAGAQKAADANERLAASAKKVDAAVSSTERVITKSSGSYNRIVGDIDPAFRAQQRFEVGQRTLQSAFERGKISAAEQSRLMGLLTEKYGKHSQALETSRRGMEVYGNTTKLTRFQMLTMQYTINDVVASLASGASPFTILMQQGGQVTQAFGGLGNTLKKLLTPTRLVVAGTAAMAFGFFELIKASNSYENSMRGLEAALTATGRAGSVNRSELERMIVSMDKMYGVNRSDAQSSIKTMLLAGDVGSEMYGTLTRLAVDYANVTGTKVPDAMSLLTNGAKNVSAFVGEMHDKFGILNDEQYKGVIRMTKHGESAEAFGIVIKALAEQMSEATKSSVTPLSTAIDNLGNSFVTTAEKIKNSGFGKSLAGIATAYVSAIGNMLTPGYDFNNSFKDFGNNYRLGSGEINPVVSPISEIAVGGGVVNRNGSRKNSKDLNQEISDAASAAKDRATALSSIQQRIDAIRTETALEVLSNKEKFIGRALLSSETDLRKLDIATRTKLTAKMREALGAQYDATEGKSKAVVNIKEHIAALEEETRQLTMSDKEIRISNELMKSHKDLMKLDGQALANAKSSLEAAVNANELAREGKEMKQSFRDVGSSIAESLSNAFVDGTSAMDTFRDAFRSLVAEMSKRILINAVMNPIADAASESVGSTFMSSFFSLFSSGGGKASGGSVYPGHVYEVGESGREKFVPSTAGRIVPAAANSNANMNFNFNVEVSGPAASDSKTASNAGNAFAMAAKAKIVEIIEEQKRPGGALWSMG